MSLTVKPEPEPGVAFGNCDAAEPMYLAALALHRHFIFGEGTINDLRCIAHFATEAFGLEHPAGERGARFARRIAKQYRLRYRRKTRRCCAWWRRWVAS